MDVERLDDLRELIGEYWCLAFAEGQEGRNTDTPDGAAQKCISAIEAIIREARAAFTPPEGYVLMPVESTPEIELAIVDWLEGRSNTGDCYTAILAARPNHIAHDLKMVASRTDHSEHYLDMVNPMSVPDGFVRVPADLVKAVEDLSLIYEAGGDIDSKLSEIEAMLAACPEVPDGRG